MVCLRCSVLAPAEVKLVAHAEEKNFTSGGRKYADLQGDHWKFGVGKNLIGVAGHAFATQPLA